MAWLSPTSGLSSSDPVTTTVIENLAHDTQFNGGNMDCGGYLHTNLAGINGALGLLTIAAKITISGDAAGLSGAYANAQFHINGATDSNRTLVMGYDTTGEFGMIGAVHNGVAVKPLILNPAGGAVSIGGTNVTAPLNVAGLTNYASNAAAISGGLTAGAFYRNGDNVCVVH